MNTSAIQESTRRHFPIDVEMYHQMADNGLFGPTDRVELIGGEIFDMSPIGKLHARCVDFLNSILAAMVGGEFTVRIQNPIILDTRSEPLPDISIARFSKNYYKEGLPESNDVVLVIEIADSSVEFDRNVKLRNYASAGIPEAWLVDLTSERVEVHIQPKASGYGLVKIYARGENAVSETIPSIDLSVDKLFG
jgi:Uma2 family endonuclease